MTVLRFVEKRLLQREWSKKQHTDAGALLNHHSTPTTKIGAERCSLFPNIPEKPWTFSARTCGPFGFGSEQGRGRVADFHFGGPYAI